MTLSPRGLRNATDSICLVLSVATGAVSIAALCIAGSEERIMSGHFGALICGTTFGWASTAFFISSYVSLFPTANSQDLQSQVPSPSPATRLSGSRPSSAASCSSLAARSPDTSQPFSTHTVSAQPIAAATAGSTAAARPPTASCRLRRASSPGLPLLL